MECPLLEVSLYYNYSYVITIQATKQKLSQQESAVAEMDGELSSLQERCALLKTKLNISEDQNQALMVCNTLYLITSCM